jgi:hypothetical protein
MNTASALFPQLPTKLNLEALSLKELIERANYANEFKNWREAFLLFKMAEEKSRAFDGHVLYRLGTLYKHGHCVNKDEQRAKEYFARALELITKKAEEGDPNAQCDLAIMYECGDGVPQNYALAVYWYQMAVEKSLDEALCNLGYMHSSGNGIPKNTILAVKYYKQAADQGYPRALYNLGYMYCHGNGVPEDKQEACRLYKLATDKGYCLAQHNLGFMYSNGFGVPKDKPKAVQYYTSAAVQGNAMSSYNLGFIYQKGEGVNQNFNLAFRCFLAGAQSGHSNSKKHLSRILNSDITGYGTIPTYYLMEEWPEAHQLLNPNCRQAIINLFLCLKRLNYQDMPIPPELITIIIKDLISVWTTLTKEKHYTQYITP